MNKKILLAGIVFLALSLIPSYASPHMGDNKKNGQLFLAQQELSFEVKPFMLSGEIMVPAKTFLERIGTQVLSVSDTGELISYRDNIFIKFSPNSKTAYVNGRAKTMPIHAVVYSGQLFIPASFAAKTLEMSYSAPSGSSSLAIDYRKNLLEYQQFGYRHFKRVTIPDWGISFFIPEYWSGLLDVENAYGISNAFEDQQLVANYYPPTTVQTRTALKDLLIEEQKNNYGDAFNLLSINTLTLGEYLSDVVSYSITDESGITNHVLYIFYEQNTGYSLHGTYKSPTNPIEAEEVLELISGTFRITKLSVNEQLEHYTELNAFHSLGIKLNRSIYSNMPISNHFVFSGTIKNADSVNGFNVIVSKDNDTAYYYVPVVDESFNMRIHTPFGLGKHNVTVLIDYEEEAVPDEADSTVDVAEEIDPIVGTGEDPPIPEIEPTHQQLLDALVIASLQSDHSMDDSDTVMKFSLLNISSNQIKDLLSTDYVNYDHQDVYNLSTPITFRLTNQYSKARALYQFVTDNYQYSELISEKGLLTTRELTVLSQANAIELCFLYTGLLRSVDIPARVVRGVDALSTYYWVETYINGRWYVSDIVSDVKLKSEIPSSHNIDPELYYSLYITIEYLPF